MVKTVLTELGESPNQRRRTRVLSSKNLRESAQSVDSSHITCHPDRVRFKLQDSRLDLLRDLDYRLYHGTPAFAQFEPAESSAAPLDLMFVEQGTWDKLVEGATEMDLASEKVLLPRPEYLVALKLHSAMSPTRSKPEVDWEVRRIVRICRLHPAAESFRDLILRYGNEDALRRIEGFARAG